MRTTCLLLFLAGLSQAAVPLQPAGDTGRYEVAAWKQDWAGSAWEDGVAEGRVDIIARGEAKRWRVSYAVGQIGPSAGGVAWNQPFAPAEEITLSYVLRFSPGFDWGKGGKLPGVGGGEKTTGGRPSDGHNGFSVRPMWRADGKAEAYVYHAGQKNNYGDSFKLPADFRLPADEDITVTLRVKLNHPERADGLLELSFATKHTRAAVRREDFVWRKSAELRASSLLFETFHGGSDLSWAPRRPCAAEFGLLRLTAAP
jgi:hypothetical protein